MKSKNCSSCKNGEKKIEADVKVKGLIYPDGDRAVPYQANLCLECLQYKRDSEGAELEVLIDYRIPKISD